MSGLTRVRDLWRDIKEVYARTLRDYAHAYGGTAEYTRVDAVYSACDTPCRIVALLNGSRNGATLRQLAHHATYLATQHGLVILSLSLKRANADLADDTLDACLARLRRNADDESRVRCGAYSFETSVNDDDDDNDHDDEIEHADDARGCDRDDAQRESNRPADVANEEIADDTDAAEEMLEMGYADRVFSRNGLASCEHTLHRFYFGKLLVPLRKFGVVNYIGMPFHKTYRCVRPDAITRMCDDAPM